MASISTENQDASFSDEGGQCVKSTILHQVHFHNSLSFPYQETHLFILMTMMMMIKMIMRMMMKMIMKMIMRMMMKMIMRMMMLMIVMMLLKVITTIGYGQQTPLSTMGKVIMISFTFVIILPSSYCRHHIVIIILSSSHFRHHIVIIIIINKNIIIIITFIPIYWIQSALACDKMCKVYKMFRYRLDSGSVILTDDGTHFGIDVGLF